MCLCVSVCVCVNTAGGFGPIRAASVVATCHACARSRGHAIDSRGIVSSRLCGARPCDPRYRFAKVGGSAPDGGSDFCPGSSGRERRFARAH
eukprot:9410494-Alexandrium_andersonii.AAC.1